MRMAAFRRHRDENGYTGHSWFDKLTMANEKEVIRSPCGWETGVIRHPGGWETGVIRHPEPVEGWVAIFTEG